MKMTHFCNLENIPIASAKTIYHPFFFVPHGAELGLRRAGCGGAVPLLRAVILAEATNSSAPLPCTIVGGCKIVWLRIVVGHDG